jgi:hypothetical protein
LRVLPWLASCKEKQEEKEIKKELAEEELDEQALCWFKLKAWYTALLEGEDHEYQSEDQNTPDAH